MINLINKLTEEHNERIIKFANRVMQSATIEKTAHSGIKLSDGSFTGSTVVLTDLQMHKPLEKQKELLIAKYTKQQQKKLQEAIDRITTIANASDFTSCTITVEWARGSMQAMQAKAELTGCGYIQGAKTGGCGYDKESTAIASVLNQCFPFLKMLYAVKNDIGNIDKENRDVFGYGSGYGILPYFEGGVGASCLYKICENIGYTFKQVASGKTFDVYTITKN